MSFALLGCNPTWVDDDPEHELGVLAYSPSTGIYQYIKANEALAARALVFKKGNNLCEQCATADIVAGRSAVLGITDVAIAANKYGWILRQGAGSVVANGVIAVGVPLFTTATAGRMDDAVVNTVRVIGIDSTGGAGAAGALAKVFVDWPTAHLA